MRNKYNYNELVKVNGIGKKFGKVENKLGFIIRKDDFYNDYYIDLIFGEKDWFDENSIERVLGEKRNKTDKYEIRLCTTKQGYELIKARIKEEEPISNNKFKKIDIYRKFQRDNKSYIIIGWKSVFWPVRNKSVNILENTLNEFKNLEIPFQYVLLNENKITDIRIMESIQNDKNVQIFSIERKIKMNNIRERKNKNDNTKNTKCND